MNKGGLFHEIVVLSFGVALGHYFSDSHLAYVVVTSALAWSIGALALYGLVVQLFE